MNLKQKKDLVDSLKKAFKEHEALFLVGYKGLTVADMQQLRSGLRKKGATLKVTKARLMKKAAEGVSEGEVLLPLFKDQIALVFASQESPGVAKVLRDFAKEHEALHILAGSYEQELLDESTINRFALLPSKEVLLAQVCSSVQAPLVGFTVLLKLMVLKLLWILKAIELQKK